MSSGGVKISKLGISWPLILLEYNISIKQISISNLLQNIRNTRTLHSLYGYSYTIHAMLQYHITSLCIYVIFQIAYWHFTWYSKRDESTSIYKVPMIIDANFHTLLLQISNSRFFFYPYPLTRYIFYDIKYIVSTLFLPWSWSTASIHEFSPFF